MEVKKVIKAWLSKMEAWFSKMETSAKERESRREVKALMAESRRALQVMEFNGELYLCYRGTPILSEDQLRYDLPTAIEESRGTYIEYVQMTQGED